MHYVTWSVSRGFRLHWVENGSIHTGHRLKLAMSWQMSQGLFKVNSRVYGIRSSYSKRSQETVWLTILWENILWAAIKPQ